MRKIIIYSIIGLAVAAGAGMLLYQNTQSATPEALLKKLARGDGNRDELVMRLNVARGDVAGAMVKALNDPATPSTLRGDLLELLCKRMCRSEDDRIAAALRQSIHDNDLAVRRRAAYCLAVYADAVTQMSMIECLKDSDPEVRRQAYIVMSGSPRVDGDDPVWARLTRAKREELTGICRQNAAQETDPEMKLMARSVLGHEIEVRGLDAAGAEQGADLDAAQRILQSALEIDPQSYAVKIRIARTLLRQGRKDEALEKLRNWQSLIEIPSLAQEPVIDGDPTDEIWKSAWHSDTFYKVTSRWVARTADGRSEAFLGYRNNKLYVAVIGYEKDLDKLSRKINIRDGNVYTDDCVEIYLDPGDTDRDFYHFVINANGTLFDRLARDKSKNYKCQYKAAVFRDRGYWACEFCIDAAELDNRRIEPGAVWIMTVIRTRIGPASEMTGIWPTYGSAFRTGLLPVAVFK